MNESQFLQLCTQQNFNIDRFKTALEIIKPLKEKKRLSGDNFFDHNLRVAKILIENTSAEEIVLAGLLHGYPDEQAIKNAFGDEIVILVKEVSEIQAIKSKNENVEAESLRKIILTTLTDVRVIFIKLANKLDNLRTISSLPEDEKKKVAEEVLEFYSPLAYRLGAEKIRTEMEDLSLKIINPGKYQQIVDYLEASREQREKEIEQAINLIEEVCVGKVDSLKIKGRPKHIYSIYKKLTERKVKLDQQYDLMGIRIIVKEVKDCYILLGILHENFEPLEGKLKDYIANPKPNFYRSIHTAIILPSRKIVEVQIRTEDMNEYAESGIAAHWKYKKLKSDENFETKMGWLRGILELQKEVETKEFLEAAKVDIFGDIIYCYTPKGNVKELPKGATILDFAYLIHEDIGNQAVAGRVNGKFSPLKKELSQGDVVEVVTNKNQRPRRDWLKIVKSGRAKQKIKKALHYYEKLPVLNWSLKPIIKEEQGILVESSEFPKSICTLAKCCNPIPGDSILGLPTKRRVISVHRDDCRLALKETNRLVPVEWKQKFNQKIRFYVLAKERSGVLADLLHTIAVAGFEVKEAKAKLIGLGNAECSFLVIPRDLINLKELIAKVNNINGIKKIYFE